MQIRRRRGAGSFFINGYGLSPRAPSMKSRIRGEAEGCPGFPENEQSEFSGVHGSGR